MNVDDENVIDDTPEEQVQLSLTESKRLIRVATTFLSITSPRPGQPSRLPTSDPAHDVLTDLNRIATLFVTKAKADVAAILISYKGGSGVQAVDTVAEIDQIFATKNSLLLLIFCASLLLFMYVCVREAAPLTSLGWC